MTWPYQNGSIRGIQVSVAVGVTLANGTRLRQFSGQKWIVYCIPDEPDEPALEGCTLGFWKQEQHFDRWEGYEPANSFNTVFTVVSHLDPPGHGSGDVLTNPSLLDALDIGGGGENGLARQAVAALLNASSTEVAMLAISVLYALAGMFFLICARHYKRDLVAR